MSENAKSSLITTSDTDKIIKVRIDLTADDASGVAGGTVACHPLNAYLPKDHDITQVDIYVEDAVESAGSTLTFSLGTDDIATEPDNLLNDCAETDLDADGDTKDGIPRAGTAATAVAVGTTDAQLAYEIKEEAATAGVLTAIITLKPTR